MHVDIIMYLLSTRKIWLNIDVNNVNPIVGLVLVVKITKILSWYLVLWDLVLKMITFMKQ